jgi:hypothetical protein
MMYRGLLLQYNCSIITQVKDFQIISKLVGPSSPERRLYGGLYREVLGDGKSYLANINQTDRSWIANLDAVAELGYTIWPDKRVVQKYVGDRPGYSCYSKEDRNITGEYPRIDQDQVFETAL